MILNRATIHSAFDSFCRAAISHGVCVGRYVIMPDHIHLFAAVSSAGPSLSEWIKSLKNSLSRTLRTEAEPAPHWQKGFFDHLLRSGESYEEKWAYVEANPERAGLVKTADDWPYRGIICELTPSNIRRS